MKDKTKERGSNVYEPVNIPIERKLVDKSAGSNEVRPQGAVLKPGGKHFEHNILLYTENLG